LFRHDFRPRAVAVGLAASVIVVACWAQTPLPRASDSPATTSGSVEMPAGPISATPSASLPLQCPYTLPPFTGLTPVTGISIRSVDRAHLEIANATDRTYYFKVYSWWVYDLDCGRGLVSREGPNGPIAPGETMLVWVEEHAPISVAVWDRPCGEGCRRAPVGQVLVPMSSLDPPSPGMS
jgi:hypothetical protein